MFRYSYREMFEAASKVKERFPWLAVIAIPWLHSTNPRELSNRVDPGQKLPRRPLEIFFRPARVGLCWLRSFQWAGVILYLKYRQRKNFRRIRGEKFDGVAKTWFVHKKKKADSGDFYLTGLQENLHSRGFRTLFLYGNVVANQWRDFCRGAATQGDSHRLPDLCLLSAWHPLWMALCQIAASARLFAASVAEKDPLVRRILKLASLDCLRAQTLLGALHYWIGRRAVQWWRPKFFVTLYEGHGWEQCLWRGIRRRDPSCKIVGYSHTVIMSHNFETFSPRTSRHEKTAPDIVLTVGRRSADILRPGHEKLGTQLIPFGSFRYSPNLKKLREPDEKRRNILVIPEGIWEEALFMFEATHRLASQLKNHHFVLRCHPVLPYDVVRPKLKADPLTLPNVELSNRPQMEADFERCGIALYRGSSSILYGILKGLKPFYLDTPTLRMIDPLFELKEWKEVLGSPESFGERLENFWAAPPEKNRESWRAAAQYVQDYIVPVDETSMKNLCAVLS